VLQGLPKEFIDCVV